MLAFPGLGTIANVLAIIFGGIIGTLFGTKIPKRIQETLNTGNAIAVMFIGIGGVMQHMLVIKEPAAGAAGVSSNLTVETTGTMMMIFSLAIGAVAGEIIDIDQRMEQFAEWLKRKTGNARDARFTDAFVNASLTVCIGAMAIVGSIQDGIYGDHSILFAKAILDMIIVMVMATSMGKGCTFSAIPVGAFQGLCTLLSVVIRPYITDTAMAHLSYVGSIMIFCVGLNLLFGKKVRVANLLPALVVAAVWK